MLAEDRKHETEVQSSNPTPEERIAALRRASDAAERSDLDRALEGVELRIAGVEAAKEAFDRAIGLRLDKEGRHWTGLAQAAYADTLDDADAARSGAPHTSTRPLPTKPVFQAGAGHGMISLHPGPGTLHRVEYRLAPGLDPVAVAMIEHQPGRGCTLIDDGASLLVSAARPAIEEAASLLLADPWRVALSILVDRCVEATLYANGVVRQRLNVNPEGAASTSAGLPLLRR
jgi:hypothetical protein